MEDPIAIHNLIELEQLPIGTEIFYDCEYIFRGYGKIFIKEESPIRIGIANAICGGVESYLFLNENCFEPRAIAYVSEMYLLSPNSKLKVMYSHVPNSRVI